MISRPSLDSAPEPASDAERLRDFSHLVSLLADQLEALEEGDPARARELDAMREKLAAEMREGEDAESPLLSSAFDRVADALERVREWIEEDRRVRDEISHLQEGSLPLVRGMRRRPGSGRYDPLGPGGTKLDVRL